MGDKGRDIILWQDGCWAGGGSTCIGKGSIGGGMLLLLLLRRCPQVLLACYIVFFVLDIIQIMCCFLLCAVIWGVFGMTKKVVSLSTTVLKLTLPVCVFSFDGQTSASYFVNDFFVE